MADKQIIVDKINKTIEQEMENLRNIAKQQIGKLEAKLKAKEQECEELKQTLTEIKPILEFYANSNMGDEQPDRTYKIVLNGSYITVYDPKPARQALQKISEVENEHNG